MYMCQRWQVWSQVVLCHLFLHPKKVLTLRWWFGLRKYQQSRSILSILVILSCLCSRRLTRSLLYVWWYNVSSNSTISMVRRLLCKPVTTIWEWWCRIRSALIYSPVKITQRETTPNMSNWDHALSRRKSSRTQLWVQGVANRFARFCLRNKYTMVQRVNSYDW